MLGNFLCHAPNLVRVPVTHTARRDISEPFFDKFFQDAELFTLIQKIRDGAMGDIQLIRAYRMDSSYAMGPFPRGQNELLWQLSPGHPYQFMWSGGGAVMFRSACCRVTSAEVSPWNGGLPVTM